MIKLNCPPIACAILPDNARPNLYHQYCGYGNHPHDNARQTCQLLVTQASGLSSTITLMAGRLLGMYTNFTTSFSITVVTQQVDQNLFKTVDRRVALRAGRRIRLGSGWSFQSAPPTPHHCWQRTDAADDQVGHILSQFFHGLPDAASIQMLRRRFAICPASLQFVLAVLPKAFSIHVKYPDRLTAWLFMLIENHGKMVQTLSISTQFVIAVDCDLMPEVTLGQFTGALQ